MTLVICRFGLTLAPLPSVATPWGRPASTWVAKLQVHAEL